MIMSFVAWLLMLVFACFTLAGIPMPPIPGRPFMLEGQGTSRFPLVNDLSQYLTTLGRDAPGILVCGIFLILFCVWFFVRQPPLNSNPRRVVPMKSFLFVMALAFIAADLSREVGVAGVGDYFKARIEWIAGGAKTGYPLAQTVALKKALASKNPTEISAALEGAITPDFANLPKYPVVSGGCITVLRDMVGAHDSDFACRLVQGITPHFGRGHLEDPSDCTYGPAIKVLHALDRQHITCPVSRLDGPYAPLNICPHFAEIVGTQAFAFCNP